jgi:hypothetical protein
VREYAQIVLREGEKKKRRRDQKVELELSPINLRQLGEQYNEYLDFWQKERKTDRKKERKTDRSEIKSAIGTTILNSARFFRHISRLKNTLTF